MTSQEKFADVQRQCMAMWEQKKALDVHCPYCDATVKAGEPPCCPTLDKAIRAIIERAKTFDAGMNAYESKKIREAIAGKYVN